MLNAARFEMKLNLDNEIDAAIWLAMQPYLSQKRASGLVRDALARVFGLLSDPIIQQTVPIVGGGAIVRAKRPVAAFVPVVIAPPVDVLEDVSDDVDAFLDSFS